MATVPDGLYQENDSITILSHWDTLFFKSLILNHFKSRAFSSCRNDVEKDKTEKYLKNILNGRLKSGSVNEIDWENEPLPKDIFTDKNKDQKSKDINKSRDTLFDPNKVLLHSIGWFITFL